MRKNAVRGDVFNKIFIILIAIVLLFLAVKRYGCNDYYENISDGDPAQSLSYKNNCFDNYEFYERPLDQSCKQPNSNFKIINSTTMVECKESLAYAKRIAYLEIQSDRLQADVDQWKVNGHVTPPGLQVPLRAAEPFVQPTSDLPRHSFEHAPKWLPKEQINNQTLVAQWGAGYLFQGNMPGHFFWIGFR
jgi:hypothetical protein